MSEVMKQYIAPIGESEIHTAQLDEDLIHSSYEKNRNVSRVSDPETIF